MNATTAETATPHHPSPPADALARLASRIEHTAHLLPAQGPITVFIHHNTLHAFENLPFDRGVQSGARIFGCEPYLSEERYRQALDNGRIRFDDLRAILHEELADLPELPAGEGGLPRGSRLDLRLAMLQFPIRSADAAELHWFVEETDALRRVRADVSAATRGRIIAETRRWALRDLRVGRNANIETWNNAAWEAFALQSLWRICREGVARVPETPAPHRPAIRQRDLLLDVTGVDTDGWVHPLLTRFCAAFLDQGLAHGALPGRENGFFQAFVTVYAQPAGPPDAWLAGLRDELTRLRTTGATPLESIRESLDLLGIEEHEHEEFLSATLLALRGWAGMVSQVEQRGDRVAHPIPAGSLVEFLAIRLILERLALAHAARRELGHTGSLTDLRIELLRNQSPPTPPSIEQRAFPVFQLAQILAWSPEELARLSADSWRTLLREIDAFGALERRRVFHAAYERHFRERTLDALALGGGARQPDHARVQVICCLDEREESFRRHLEEIAPDVETFGAAGFFSVPMYYRAADDAHFVPLCPIVVQPRHWVEECVDAAHEEEHRRSARARKAVGQASHRLHRGTRGFFTGAFLTATFGLFASIPLVARVLFPRFSARVRRLFGQFVRKPQKTCLKVERNDPTPGPDNGGRGYSLGEMTDMGERLLRDIGLTENFARLVLVIGHGSASLNNPHKSAYDCGACGGSAGGPNARALAAILNDERVRAGLASRGVVIPTTTRFVGGQHNTCNDSVTFFDGAVVPDTHREEFERIVREIDATCERNAHERCRRFQSAPPELAFAAAREHVEARSEDLAQTRPELGHATNAICVVGRRARTRGLFLDRRAFLVSYDPNSDDAESAILARVLAAVFPVCAGINLEYYFSHVDSPGWGCGTKLPHNITSLLGVMDGASSDLRTGLPWQMVEIHEPVRLLFVVEATPEALLSIMNRNEGIGRLVRNGWVQLASQHPTTGEIVLFHRGAFRTYHPTTERLPVAASSVDWYRGWRDHLEFARIEAPHA